MDNNHGEGRSRLNAESFRQARVLLDEETLNGLLTHDDVRKLAYRLMSEAEIYLRLSSTVLQDCGGQVLPYRRLGAILAGNLIRVHKLVRSFICLMEAGQGYGAKMLERPINEGMVTFLYLARRMDQPKEYDRYVRGGLGNLKKALEMVKGAPGANHALTPVVQSSVDFVFKTAGFTLEEIDVKDDKKWKEDVMARLKVVCAAHYENLTPEQVAAVEYMGMFAGPAGNIHGDWADLILNHLKPLEGGFLPNAEGAWPEADSTLRTVQFIGLCVEVFMRCVQPRTEDTAWILSALQDFRCRVQALDNFLGDQQAQGKLYPGSDVRTSQ